MDEHERRLCAPLLRALNLDPYTGQDDIRDVVEVAEAEIARRGLQAAYIIAIGESMGFDMNTVPVTQLPPIFWAFLTATPEVRVRALLRALGEG